MECHTKWKILETKNKQKILTDKLEIHIIQLDKLKENIKNINDNLLDWLMFLENPKSERVIKKMDENKALKEAKQKLDKLTPGRAEAIKNVKSSLMKAKRNLTKAKGSLTKAKGSLTRVK